MIVDEATFSLTNPPDSSFCSVIPAEWISLAGNMKHTANTTSTMVNIITHIRERWTYALVPLGAVVGYYLDRWNDSRMSLFKNKSKLFQR
ncbi:NADH dehydrogenase [ubiquinone] 1 beta subcomplex subunit 1-like [Engystomops pustulosus]|uniref:NADH dehydrogenase [ubiquinone] 1 beta subcomplex subunit 1-like n=1 Tax=Engystomops pustulosus TaxID=76066 RepID=UPI003AFA419E